MQARIARVEDVLQLFANIPPGHGLFIQSVWKHLGAYEEKSVDAAIEQAIKNGNLEREENFLRRLC